MNTIIWVHSINETSGHITTLDTLCQDKSVKFGLPVRILTRASQETQYREVVKNYKDFFDDIELVTGPDEEFSDLGKTKNFEIHSSMELRVFNVFQFDDDITKLYSKFESPEETIKYWFKLHFSLIKEDQFCIMTSVLKDLSKANPTGTAELYQGICTQCTLINVKRAINNQMLYNSNIDVGHEDVDYRAELIKNGWTYYRFTEIIYGTEPLNTDTFSGTSLQERFTRQQELFKKKWGERYHWVLYTTSEINGVKLDDVRLDPFIDKRRTLYETYDEEKGDL